MPNINRFHPISINKKFHKIEDIKNDLDFQNGTPASINIEKNLDSPEDLQNVNSILQDAIKKSKANHDGKTSDGKFSLTIEW